MSQRREVLTAISMTLIVWVITAIFYPILLWGIGQVFFPFQANGSLLNYSEKLVGSALIGQVWQSDRYFWSRPSAVNYSQGKEASLTGISGATNLAATNPKLRENIIAKITKLNQNNLMPTADLIYSSGSGLDPHISLKSARNQIERVANVRNLDSNQVEILITKSIEGRFLGIFGEPGVNVLKLNLALDTLN